MFGPSTFLPEAWGAVFDIANLCGDASTHKDPRVGELFDALTAARDAEARNQAAHAIEEYVLFEKAYVLPIKTWVTVLAFRDYVQGIAVARSDIGNGTDFSTVWLDK